MLIVTKLDRLGRDAIDVSMTVKALAETGGRVHCLALGGVDLTSSSGTMTMNVLNAVAQFERDLRIERTQSGLKRAKSEGKVLGHPSSLGENQKQDVREDLNRGMSISAVARKFATSRQTITRVRETKIQVPFRLVVKIQRLLPKANTTQTLFLNFRGRVRRGSRDPIQSFVRPATPPLESACKYVPVTNSCR